MSTVSEEISWIAYDNLNLDHAAMILRYNSKPDEVSFLEVTSDQHVLIASWSQIKSLIGTNFQKVALRHLIWDRPDSGSVTIEKFIEGTENIASKRLV